MVRRGIAMMEAGDFDQAEKLFRQILESKQAQAEAHNQLGFVFAQTDRLEKAEAAFRQAIALNPEFAEAHLILGKLLVRGGRAMEAAEAFRRAVEINPAYPQEYYELGVAQDDAGLTDEALVSLCQAIVLAPQFAQAYHRLGLALQAKDRLEEAAACIVRSIEIKADDAAPYSDLAFIQTQLHRPEEALSVLAEAARLFPDHAGTLNNLGLALTQANRAREAEVYIRRAIALESGNPEAYSNLGIIMKDTGRLKEAEEAYRKAIALSPNNPVIYNNLGNTLTVLRRFGEAEAAYRRGMAAAPCSAESSLGLAALFLLQDRFDEGWKLYDHWRRKEYDKRRLPIRRWSGEDLGGRSILLYNELGFGDTMQFGRFAPLVASQAAETVLLVQKPLQRLFAASFPELSVRSGDELAAGGYDFAYPFPSLPAILHTTLATIPCSIPYLRATATVTNAWRGRLDGLLTEGGPRIGVVWAGNPKHANDRNRSIPFLAFEALLAASDVHWVSLQVGARAADLDAKAAVVTDLSGDLHDFMETAGVIENLDMVITVDSAVAHLAGAMGKKTWVILPFMADWRWRPDGTDSPWYSTVRLFRQRGMGDWQEVIERIKAALAQELGGLRRDL